MKCKRGYNCYNQIQFHQKDEQKTQRIPTNIPAVLQGLSDEIVKQIVTETLEQNFFSQDILGAMLDGMSVYVR